MSKFKWQHEGIVYRVAQQAETQSIYELVMSDFIPHMPLFQYPPTEVDPDVMLEFVQKVIAQGVSLVAEDSVSGELVGARLNITDSVQGSSFDLPPPPATVPARYRRMFQVFAMAESVEAAVDCFKLYNVDRALCYRLLVVRQSAGRRGIGRRLNICALSMARSLGFPLVKGSTEMLYSQKINLALGFDVVHRLVYKDYVDPDSGERPFVEMDATVHKEAVMFARRTDDLSDVQLFDEK